MIFNDYFKNFMRKPPPNVVLTDVTWEKYDGFVKHLDKFKPDLRFDEIDWEIQAVSKLVTDDQYPSQEGEKKLFRFQIYTYLRIY